MADLGHSDHFEGFWEFLNQIYHSRSWRKASRIVTMDGGNNIFSGGEVGFKFIPFDVLAEKVGVHAVVLRFVTALLAGYPFTVVYFLFPKKNETFNHIYFILCGLLMSYFCFGSDSAYTLISVLVSYVSFTILGTGIWNVIFTFVFQMGYLLGAYVVYASDGYDIKWTTPQCLLCLKLVGLALDC